MTLDDNRRSNTNSHECLHAYCSTVYVGVLEVRCNIRLRTGSHISQITACGAGDHQQTGTGVQYCWPMCVKVQWHYTIGLQGVLCGDINYISFSNSVTIYIIYMYVSLMHQPIKTQHKNSSDSTFILCL